MSKYTWNFRTFSLGKIKFWLHSISFIRYWCYCYWCWFNWISSCEVDYPLKLVIYTVYRITVIHYYFECKRQTMLKMETFCFLRWKQSKTKRFIVMHDIFDFFPFHSTMLLNVTLSELIILFLTFIMVQCHDCSAKWDHIDEGCIQGGPSQHQLNILRISCLPLSYFHSMMHEMWRRFLFRHLISFLCTIPLYSIKL